MIAPLLARLLVLFWFAGAAVEMFGVARRIRRSRRMVADAVPVLDPEVTRALSEMAARARLRRVPLPFASAAASGPLVIGPLRPRLVLPADARDRFTTRELDLALAHEIAHVRRGDLLLALVPLAIRCLFFFHPLARLVEREWSAAAEAACDADALRLTGARPRDFGRLLLKLGESGTAPETAAALGMASGFPLIERRLRSLETFSPSQRRALGIATTAIIALAAIAIVPWRLASRLDDRLATFEHESFLFQPSPPPIESVAAWATASRTLPSPAPPLPVIYTIAGRGDYGKSGDGGPATRAYFFNTGAPAIDDRGNVFVPDINNSRVRRVGPDGIVTSVAGVQNGTAQPTPSLAQAQSWQHEEARLRRLFHAGSRGPGRILDADFRAPGRIGDGGPATRAALQPWDAAADLHGDLYVSDSWNECIRRIDARGVISTVAGRPHQRPYRAPGFEGDGGPASDAVLDRPSGIALDAVGDLFIVDTGDQRIRKVTPDGGITTVAGDGVAGFSGDGGPATRAQLHEPSAIAIGPAGDLFIADAANGRIRKVSRDGTISTVVGGAASGMEGAGRGRDGDGGPATRAALLQPQGLAIDSAGTLFISDSLHNRIRKVTRDGTISTIAGIGEPGFTGDGGPAIVARLSFPGGLAIDAAGDLLIADNSSIREIPHAAAPGLLAGAPFPPSARPVLADAPPVAPPMVSPLWRPGAPAADPGDPKGERECEAHLARIRDALVAYQRDRGGLPAHLSDLYPRYISDPSVFHCPADPSPGTAGYPGCAPIHENPRLPMSYLYEMSVDRMGRLGYVWLGPEVRGYDATPYASWRDVRTWEIHQFGDRVPIVTCHHHEHPGALDSATLILPFSGQIYRSHAWEYDPRTVSVMLDRIARDLNAGQAAFDRHWLMYKFSIFISGYRWSDTAPGGPDPRVMRERLRALAGRLARIAGWYHGPLYCDLFAAVGSTYRAAGDYDRAIAYYRRSLSLPGNHDQTEPLLERTYDDAGMPGQAAAFRRELDAERRRSQGFSIQRLL